MPRRPTPLQREIGQRRPFRSPGHEAVVAIIRTAAVVQRRLATLITPAGISTQQYNVLRIVRGAGRDGIATLAIRDRLIDLAPGITRLVDGLERKGLLSRAPQPGDRRRVICRLTPAGAGLLRRLDPVVDRAEAEVTARLSPEETRRLLLALETLREG